VEDYSKHAVGAGEEEEAGRRKHHQGRCQPHCEEQEHYRSHGRRGELAIFIYDTKPTLYTYTTKII
jgi:hypothetical protein